MSGTNLGFKRMDTAEYLFGDKFKKDDVISKKKKSNVFKYFTDGKDKLTEILYNMTIFANESYKDEITSGIYYIISEDSLPFENTSDHFEDIDLHKSCSNQQSVPKTEKITKYKNLSNLYSDEKKDINCKDNLDDSTISAPPIADDVSKFKYTLEKETKNFRIHNHPKRKKMTSKSQTFYGLMFKFSFLVYLVLFSNDLYSKYKESQEKLNSNIQQWKKEYNSNNCENITLEDSPIIFSYCQKKRESIETSKIYITHLLIEFLIETINIFSYKITYKSMGTIILFIVIFYKVIRRNI